MPLTIENVRHKLSQLVVKELPRSDGMRFAAVAAVLRYPEPSHDPEGNCEVLLIRRTDKPGDRWSGHMAFPGGRKEEEDADLVATAIRETHEEVGIDLHTHGELLGRLDDVQAIARGEPMDLIIVPYVFLLQQSTTSLTVQDSEVAEAFWTPLLPMLRGETATGRPYEHKGQRFELPGYQVGEHVVWGLTHRMLELLFVALRR